jgi:hypothetical protein
LYGGAGENTAFPVCSKNRIFDLMELFVEGTAEKVFEACKKAINNLGWSIEYSNKAKGVISAATRSTLLSWGETIDLKIVSVKKSECKIDVDSNSKAQLFDWGKNERNMTDLTEEIKKALRR